MREGGARCAAERGVRGWASAVRCECGPRASAWRRGRRRVLLWAAGEGGEWVAAVAGRAGQAEARACGLSCERGACWAAGKKENGPRVLG